VDVGARLPSAGFRANRRAAQRSGGGLVLIPLLIVRDLPEAVAFYTQVLDFGLALATPENTPFYAILKRGEDELHLNLTPGDGRFGHCSAIVVCEDVDTLFSSFQAKGLTLPVRPDSPVHQGPVDQSWGTRELYVDDPSGNTIIFQQR
jgi:catechol 2,3-dioxygenase-like lactoylglutathione lyase family enzyme